MCNGLGFLIPVLSIDFVSYCKNLECFKLIVNDFFELAWNLGALYEVNEVKRILDLLREEPGSILSPDLDKVMTRQLSLRTKTCFPLHKAISLTQD